MHLSWKVGYRAQVGTAQRAVLKQAVPRSPKSSDGKLTAVIEDEVTVSNDGKKQQYYRNRT